ncbi:glycosyltransferase [Paenibacillus solani]|uniref:glycosyltransferase n=1 Tax=Paenibacillus solani TaxID=1705565 RepID=UPI003D2A5129
MKLSLCMIVKNEEINLNSFFPTMKNQVDEIIVVDTGSTDQTIDLCRMHADKVISNFTFSDFSAARNESIKYATGDWIIVLDADELILQDEMNDIKRSLASSQYDAHRLPRYNYIGEGMWSTSSIVRLFRNGKNISFSRKVHESVRESLMGKEAPLIDTYIHHFPSAGQNKNEMYISWLSEYIKVNNDDLYAKEHLSCEYFVVGQHEKAFELANEVLSRNEKIQRMQTNLGFMYLSLNRWETAKYYFDNALDQIDSANSSSLASTILSGLSVISYSTGKYEESLAYSQSAISKSPNSSHLYINAGLALRKMQKQPESSEYFEKSVEINPFIQNDRIYFSSEPYRNSIYSLDNVFVEPYKGLLKSNIQ